MKELSKEIDSLRVAGNGHSLLDEMWANKPFARKMQELDVSYEESKEQLPILSRFYESLLACSSCPGLKKCNAELPRYVTEVIRDEDGALKLRTGPCVRAQNEELVKLNLIYHDVPDDWMEADEKISERARSLYESGLGTFLKGGKPWVYVTGEAGTGKSFLSFSLAKNLAGASFKKKVAFIDTVKRFDELKGTAIKDRVAFEASLGQLQNVEILFLDSFGDEFKSDYVRDTILMPLLSSRSNRKLPTFFISSYSREEIKQLYSNSATGRIVATRLMKLLNANCGKDVIITERYDINNNK